MILLSILNFAYIAPLHRLLCQVRLILVITKIKSTSTIFYPTLMTLSSHILCPKPKLILGKTYQILKSVIPVLEPIFLKKIYHLQHQAFLTSLSRSCFNMSKNALKVFHRTFMTIRGVCHLNYKCLIYINICQINQIRMSNTERNKH